MGFFQRPEPFLPQQTYVPIDEMKDISEDDRTQVREK